MKIVFQGDIDTFFWFIEFFYEPEDEKERQVLFPPYGLKFQI